MCRLMSVIGLVLLLCISIAVAADPYEVNPMRESVVVDASWGDEPGNFVWRGDYWGQAEVVGFGPYTVVSGEIYIVDAHVSANDVKVFDLNGAYIRTVPLLKEHNVVHDIAVVDGVIYTMGETLWGHRVLVVNPGKQQLDEIQLTASLNPSTTDAGKPYVGNCIFNSVSAGDLRIFDRRAGQSYPLLRNGKVVPVEEQISARSAGLKSDAAAVKYHYENGDIVRVNSAGQIEKILVRNAGWLWGATGGYVLTETYEKVEGETRFYYLLLDTDGTLLSRTRIPVRNALNVEIRQRIRLLDDGSFCELYVDESGVRVSRFSR